jgi:gliding motility-associated-like protein
MKPILTVILVAFTMVIAQNAYSQLANDVCAGAINLGTLGTPNPCDGSGTEGQGAPTVTNGLTNVGSISENPYSTIVSCQGILGNDMSSPASDVWYSFTATGNNLIVNITGLTTPNIGIYYGNCAALTPYGCDIGAGGVLNTSFTQLFPGTTYYIQISGGDVADQGVFNLTLQNDNSCNDCLVTSTLSATPPPQQGGYMSGQTVTFCYTVTDWIQQNTNWFQGIEIQFGAGWDMTSLTGLTPAASCDGTGAFGWYNSITSTATGNTYGNGFYYDTGGDGIPGNNFGDNCGQGGTSVNPIVNWQFCWTITAQDCPPAASGADLGLVINTLGDGECGSWSNLACVGDPDYIFSANLICCTPPIMSSTDATCFGTCDGTGTAVGQGAPPFTYQWDAAAGNQATAVATGLCAGAYVVTVTDSLGCITTGNVTINEPPQLTVTTSFTDPLCNGDCNGSVGATGAGGTGVITYSWTTLGAGQNHNGIVCAGTYTVTVTDANGCTASAPATVTDPPLLTASLVSTTDATCGQANGQGVVTSSGGTGAVTYDIGSGPQASGTFNNLAAGPYTVTATDANGCTVLVPFTINDLSGITGNILAQSDATCFGSCDGSVTVLGSGSVSPYTYDIGAGPQASGTFNNLCAGNYTVNVTDASGCVFPVPVVINEPPALTSGTTGTDALCNLSCDGTIDLTIGGGVTPYGYSWTGPGGPYLTEDLANLCAGTYNVTVTDANGCTIADSYTINEPTAIVLNTTSNPSNCGQADGSVGVTATGGTVAVDYTYVWTDAASTTVGTSAIANNLVAGTYTVVVTDDNGCTATTTSTITTTGGGTASAAVTSNYNGEDISCNGACDGEFTVTMVGGTSPYTYDIGNGPQASNIFTGQCAGNYTIDIVDALGCLAATTVTLTEPTPVSFTTVTTDEICIGDCLGSITITASGGTPPYTYSVDDCNTNQAGNSFSNLCANTYQVCVEDANGCQFRLPVVIQPGAAYADATITPIGPFCENDPAANLTGATAGGTWVGTGVSGSTFDPSTAGAGTHTITYQISSVCGDTATADIVVNPLPTITFVADITSGCEPLTVNFTNTGTAGPTCFWEFGDGNTSASCGPVTHTYASAGNYDVTLTVTDANGCSNTFTAVNYIQVFANPIADFDFGPQPTSFMHPTINFTDQSVDAVAWDWDFAGLGSSTQQHPSFDFTQIGSYDVTLIVMSAEGCTDTITQTVIIDDEFLIYVPNAFTIDNDGINDIFLPIVNGVDPLNYTLYIFNRWGQLIFESNHPTIGWDGRYKGSTVQQDVYVWKIQLRDGIRGEKHEYIGHVTLLR